MEITSCTRIELRNKTLEESEFASSPHLYDRCPTSSLTLLYPYVTKPLTKTKNCEAAPGGASPGSVSLVTRGRGFADVILRKESQRA